MAFIHRTQKKILKKKRHRSIFLKDFVLPFTKRPKRCTQSKLAELRVKLFHIADDLNFNNVDITYLDADLDTIMTDAFITDDVIMEEVWQEDDMMIIDDEASDYRYQVDISLATGYNEFNEDDQSKERSLKLFILLESFYEKSIRLTEADIRLGCQDTPFDSTGDFILFP